MIGRCCPSPVSRVSKPKWKSRDWYENPIAHGIENPLRTTCEHIHSYSHLIGKTLLVLLQDVGFVQYCCTFQPRYICLWFFEGSLRVISESITISPSLELRFDGWTIILMSRWNNFFVYELAVDLFNSCEMPDVMRAVSTSTQIHNYSKNSYFQNIWLNIENTRIYISSKCVWDPLISGREILTVSYYKDKKIYLFLFSTFIFSIIFT